MLHSAQKELNDISNTSHEGGCSVWPVGVGVVFRALAQRGYSGLGMAECKGQALCGAVGVERKAGAAHKLICHTEYVAAVLHYQCMSSPTATVDSLV